MLFGFISLAKVIFFTEKSLFYAPFCEIFWQIAFVCAFLCRFLYKNTAFRFLKTYLL